MLTHKILHSSHVLPRSRAAPQADPEHARAYYGWGSALLKQGKNEEAAEKFRIARELDPNLPLPE